MKSTELTIVAEAPARGAGLNQVIGLSIAALVITLVLLWVGYAHRNHRIEWLTRIADKIGEKFHRPSWVIPFSSWYSRIRTGPSRCNGVSRTTCATVPSAPGIRSRL